MKRAQMFFLTAVLIASQQPFLYAAENEWTFAGWYGGGMYPSLTADPQKEGRLYLSSDVAGIWRSEDRGENWVFANKGLDNLNVAVLAVSGVPEKIYAGTNSSLVSSETGGKEWMVASKNSNIGFQKPDNYRSIVVDPKDADHVYVGTKLGQVFHKEGSAPSWKTVGKSEMPFGEKVPITALVMDENNSKIFAFSKLGGIRFDPETNAWARLDLPEAVLDAVWDKNGAVLYAATGKKIAYSKDDGQSWKYTKEIPKQTISRLAISTKSGKTRILAGWRENWKGGLFLSDDGGETWQNAVGDLVHDETSNPTRKWMKGFARPNAVQIDPFNPDIFYFTDSWGVWRSDDAGATWHEKIKGAPNTSGSDLVIDEEGTIFVATMDDGLLSSKDGGKNYEPVLPTQHFLKNISGHAWRVLSQPKHGRILVTASPWHEKSNHVFWSDDGGKTFAAASGLPEGRSKKNTMWGSGYPRALAADSFDENRLYLGIDGDDGGGFFTSEDGGKTWMLSSGQPGSLRIYNALAVDPTEKGRLIWGACAKGGGIYLSLDGGKVWKNVFSKMNWVFDAAISKSGKMYAAGADGKPAFYVSENHGATWEPLYRSDSGDAMDSILIDPKNENILYGGLVTWGGKAGGRVLRSLDAGKKWDDITGSLPESSGPAAMALSPASQTLYVLLYAGSVYKWTEKRAEP